MFEFILKSTTGPAFVSSAEPGWSPLIMRGIMKMKKGTVIKAIIEYTADRVAFFSSDSMDDLKQTRHHI